MPPGANYGLSISKILLLLPIFLFTFISIAPLTFTGELEEEECPEENPNDVCHFSCIEEWCEHCSAVTTGATPPAGCEGFESACEGVAQGGEGSNCPGVGGGGGPGSGGSGGVIVSVTRVNNLSPVTGIQTGPGGGGPPPPCNNCYQAWAWGGIPTSFQVNPGQPNQGDVLISKDPTDPNFTLSSQTKNGKVRITIEYKYDWFVLGCLSTCTFPSQPPAPDLSNEQMAAYLAITFRINDPPDPSIYAVNSGTNDNNDPNRKRGNLSLPSGYSSHPNGCQKTDAQGNTYKLSVIPKLIGTAPSLSHPEVSAYRYRVEIDLEITNQWGGDNYLLDAAMGTHCYGTNPQGYCNSWGPVFYNDIDCDPQQPNNPKTPLNQGSTGTYSAWKRVYPNIFRSYKIGAELIDDTVPGTNQFRIWEPDPAAGPIFLPLETIIIFDVEDPIGQVLNIESISTTPDGVQSTITTLQNISTEFRSGYPNDFKFPKINGRGASVVSSTVGCWTEQTGEMADAFDEAFHQINFKEGGDFLPAFHIRPQDNDFTNWPGPSFQSIDKAVEARSGIWGLPAPPLPNNYELWIGNTLWTDPTTVNPGIGKNLGSPPYAFLAYSVYDLAGCFFGEEELQEEWTAHESGHVLSNTDCTHTEGIFAHGQCLMNNSLGSGLCDGIWSDGHVDMFQEPGSPSSLLQHYYRMRGKQDPF